ncbi:hypothetical protein P280DRAFT_552563 [Massarina eburnea CBS 473.64]|uniref:Uncharacterized protein n=1 Tax=Massarina eburnea CBS 473.64 TaxID=1395130 RepID=A0A6A6RSX2_9PLEO|nr:hypothetical protein P280DRAFT_552563 [Massarina eburnea CBS 473.64]
MTACVVRFAVPPERLERDASEYMTTEIGPTWPQESHKIILNNLNPERQTPGKAASPIRQLESKGFAILKDKSTSLGALHAQEKWNTAYLEETAQMIKNQLGADEQKAIQGLQFGTVVRPVAASAHVDQDGPNSRRMCEGAASEDVFERLARMQQLNVWRPLKGPVTCKPMAVCEGSTVSPESKSVHMGLFGTRVVVHHDAMQKWCFIKRQEPNEVFILKIYDSQVLPGDAECTPHTSVDEINGADGPQNSRESIEVRLVACYY